VKPRTATLVDLFCGAGGLSLGFCRAGIRPIHAIDHWKPAVDTYRSNLGDHVVLEEITEDTVLPESTLIAGGPPCQGFSSAGRRNGDDKRNTLVTAFAQLVVKHKPTAFVFENVEGFLTGANGSFVFELLSPLLEAGYRIHLRKINAANYGVPQLRKRVIGIGGLGWSPSFPEPTHTAYGAPGADLATRIKPRTPTIADALDGLPVASSDGREKLLDHIAQPFTGLDLERARLLKPGQRMRDLPEELWHDSYRKRAFRRVMDGTPTERRGGAPAGMRRLCADEPAKAITGGALRDFVHPAEHRPLTLRECARLQTFPDEYVFAGSRANRALLIGNAVPPMLAETIARCLLRDLQEVTPGAEFGGTLLSFIPTLSEGMSPLLQSVLSEVSNRFGPIRERERQRLLWD